jgi:hypothetical protein
MGYHLEGKLLEVCDCNVLCPCWIGENPDNGTCQTIISWHFERGEIDGTDVSGLTLAVIAHVPGNILEGNWKAAVYVDDKASETQQAALLKVFTGQAGGPVADLAKLIGEVVSVERVPIEFAVSKGKGTIKVGNAGYAELESFTGAMGGPTTLSDTVFSTVPGAPVYVGKAATYRASVPAAGIAQNLTGHNALQSNFVFDG